MGVKTEHSEYTAMKAEWQKCIDFMESEKAVHDAGETYLPRLSEQDDDEYENYKYRAPVVMISKRSNKAMVGMVTRKAPYISDVETIADLIKSIDADGNDFETYQSRILSRFNCTGRCGTLIDVPKADDRLTVAQAEELGVRPRFVKYNELDIINWRVEKIGNVNKLVMVVLREEKDNIVDEFDWDVEYQYRVLDIKDGVYRQRLFDESEHVIEEIYPKFNGSLMSFLPFFFHGGIKVQQPPLNEVVDLNRHHFQLSADESEGLRLAALPTPYFFGADPNEPDFPNHVGPACVIGSKDTDCKTGFREFTGAGLESVAKKLEKYEQLMAQLSVQFATDTLSDTSATESAINQGNSTASLAGMVQVLSNEFTQLLKILAEWSGRNPENIECQLNTDFTPANMTAQDMQALLNLYISGTITYDTFYKNLAKGEITDPNKDSQEEKDEIDVETPPGL